MQLCFSLCCLKLVDERWIPSTALLAFYGRETGTCAKRRLRRYSVAVPSGLCRSFLALALPLPTTPPKAKSPVTTYGGSEIRTRFSGCRVRCLIRLLPVVNASDWKSLQSCRRRPLISTSGWHRVSCRTRRTSAAGRKFDGRDRRRSTRRSPGPRRRRAWRAGSAITMLPTEAGKCWTSSFESFLSPLSMRFVFEGSRLRILFPSF